MSAILNTLSLMTRNENLTPAAGMIESVTGRADGRGIPELSAAVFRLADGTRLEARLPRLVGDEVTFNPLPVAFEFRDFGVCPICLDPSAASREHVPPHAIGGTVLTLTCERCNNEFGSKYEPHLQKWYDGAIGKVRLSGGTVPGNRVAGDYLLRENPAGGFVLIQHGYRDPAVDEILRSTTGFQMSYPQADHARMHIAAVKTAYLAACVALREVPQTPRADALRKELVAARDTPRTTRLTLSPLLSSIRVARSATGPAPGETLLMAATNPTGGVDVTIGFNRVFAVDWPLDPITHLRAVHVPTDDESQDQPNSR